MDPASNNALSIAAIIVSVGSTVLAVVNHKRIRSSCCGREATASLDVEATTPPRAVLSSVPPLPPT